MPETDGLVETLADRSATVGVIGLGYVGLPLSIEFSEAGFDVAGYDINRERVDMLRGGESYVDDVTDETLQAALDAGFRPGDVPSAVEGCDAYVIAVPTGLRSGQPDMTAVRSATEVIADHADDRETLVVVSSTVYPGATSEEVEPILEARRDSANTHVAMVPERLNPGGDYPFEEISLVVGADDPAAREAAETLFGAVVSETCPVDSTTTAELSKTFENTYRMVNIALVNQFAGFVEKLDADVWGAIDAAATKPFGFQAFYPGPGVGGHCIPIDPQFLTWRASELDADLSLVEDAHGINEAMPMAVVDRAAASLRSRGVRPEDARIVTLGVTYKPGVADTRHSPALEISRTLDEVADLVAVDPYVTPGDVDLPLVSAVADAPLERADLVVLLVDHEEFDLAGIAERASLLLDTRNAVPEDVDADVVTLGATDVEAELGSVGLPD